MVKRRTLSDALSEDEIAFYQKGEGVQTVPKPASGQPQTAVLEMKPQPPVAKSPEPEEEFPAFAPTESFVSLNTRITRSTRNRLKRVVFEREMRMQAPFSIQDIVEQAVNDWLKKQEK